MSVKEILNKNDKVVFLRPIKLKDEDNELLLATIGTTGTIAEERQGKYSVEIDRQVPSKHKIIKNTKRHWIEEVNLTPAIQSNTKDVKSDWTTYTYKDLEKLAMINGLSWTVTKNENINRMWVIHELNKNEITPMDLSLIKNIKK